MNDDSGARWGQWSSIEIKRAIELGFCLESRVEMILAENIYSGGSLEEYTTPYIIGTD